ncbi:PilZ domain-containing protein [Bradyrhizobium sp. JYMT SZCCT0428]|uniref:PilZ domain-containing protein n=1 Tax=Bradyrhizobium sp. JYMT SZCCT0428 TaxID=2807673 RepID=UPI001BAC9297|nr:PilZ domain-containing protein [Bradyrhizobium sp. JYMT SZCCT0428]MBR1157536.1 PilZ domain-containing protein [Bradyrhizobium sp. JYMT SZCCT0428]
MATIAKADAEARKTPRNRVLETGLIRFEQLSVPCVLRNFSEAGAALDVGPYSLIPDHFTLIVVRKKKSYPCSVIWRKGTRLGVSFSTTEPNDDALDE